MENNLKKMKFISQILKSCLKNVITEKEMKKDSSDKKKGNEEKEKKKKKKTRVT